MRKKIHSYLGFAKRSRSLISGYNSCEHGMARKKIRLLLLAEDLAENTVKKFTAMAREQGTPLRIYGTREELSAMAGEEEKGIFGITDENLAKVIMKEIDEEVCS